MAQHTDRSVIPILAAANFVVGMGAFMVVGLMPPLIADFGITPARAGWLMTAYALAYAVLSPLLVSLTGRIGRRRVLVGGLSVFGLAHLLGALAQSDVEVYWTRALAAAGASVITPVAAAVAASLSPPERQARALSSVFLGMTMANVLGLPAGGWLAYTFGWRSAFWTVAVLAVPISVAVWVRVPRGLSFAPVSLSALGQTLASARLMAGVSFTVIFMGGLFTLFTYYTPLMTEKMGLGRNAITLLLVLAGLGAILGTLGGGHVTDRIGTTRSLVVVVIGQTLLLPLYGLLPFPFWLLVLLSILWSALGFSFMAAQQSRLIALAPERAQVLLSLNAAAIYVGTAAGAALGAGVIRLWGMGSLGPVAAVLTALSGVSLLLVRPRGAP